MSSSIGTLKKSGWQKSFPFLPWLFLSFFPSCLPLCCFLGFRRYVGKNKECKFSVGVTGMKYEMAKVQKTWDIRSNLGRYTTKEVPKFKIVPAYQLVIDYLRYYLISNLEFHNRSQLPIRREPRVPKCLSAYLSTASFHELRSMYLPNSDCRYILTCMQNTQIIGQQNTYLGTQLVGRYRPRVEETRYLLDCLPKCCSQVLQTFQTSIQQPKSPKLPSTWAGSFTFFDGLAIVARCNTNIYGLRNLSLPEQLQYLYSVSPVAQRTIT